VTNEQSFENVKNWIQSINDNADKDIVKMLVATKVDMEEDRKVTREEGEELAQEYGIDYIETSAKADINVKASVQAIMEKVFIQIKSRQTVPHKEAAREGTISLGRSVQQTDKS